MRKNAWFHKPKKISGIPTDNRRTAEATCWKWFSLMIRLRDADDNGYSQCFTCWARKHYKEMDAGHFKSVGAHPNLKYDEMNCHSQCTSCNQHHHGNLDIYTERMIELYGPEILVILKVQEQLHHRATSQDYRRMAAEYREKANVMLKRMPL